jgi:hypothetical protein
VLIVVKGVDPFPELNFLVLTVLRQLSRFGVAVERHKGHPSPLTINLRWSNLQGEKTQ